MQRRRELMAMQAGLPSAYRKVEYLESNGGQYFWTDVPVQEGLTVESIQMFVSGNDSYLFGGAVNTNNDRSNFNGFYGQRLQGAYPKGYYNSSTSLAYNTVYCIKTTHEDGTATTYVDGNLFHSLVRSGTVPETGATCACFGARASNGNILGSPNLYKGKVYSIKVSKHNTILANYIPCVRKSDSKPGMYDTVSKTFYTNAGTGEFIVPA